MGHLVCYGNAETYGAYATKHGEGAARTLHAKRWPSLEYSAERIVSLGAPTQEWGEDPHADKYDQHPDPYHWSNNP